MTVYAQTTSSHVGGGYDSPNDDVVERQERKRRARSAEVGHTLSTRRDGRLRCIVVRGRCLTRQLITSGRHREPQKRFRLAIIGRPACAVNTKERQTSTVRE